MQETMERMKKGAFTLDDFLKQMRQIRRMGSFQSLLGLIPGMGKYKEQLKNVDLDGREMKHLEAIILSMTPQERCDPAVPQRKPEETDCHGVRNTCTGCKPHYQAVYGNAETDEENEGHESCKNEKCRISRNVPQMKDIIIRR